MANWQISLIFETITNIAIIFLYDMILHEENRNLKFIKPDPQLYGKGDLSPKVAIWGFDSLENPRGEKVSWHCTH